MKLRWKHRSFFVLQQFASPTECRSQRARRKHDGPMLEVSVVAIPEWESEPVPRRRRGDCFFYHEAPVETSELSCLTTDRFANRMQVTKGTTKARRTNVGDLCCR